MITKAQWELLRKLKLARISIIDENAIVVDAAGKTHQYYGRTYDKIFEKMLEDIDALDPMVETVNILSGKKCMIRASEKGGCCDPGTETYHCM